MNIGSHQQNHVLGDWKTQDMGDILKKIVYRVVNNKIKSVYLVVL